MSEISMYASSLGHSDIGSWLVEASGLRLPEPFPIRNIDIRKSVVLVTNGADSPRQSWDLLPECTVKLSSDDPTRPKVKAQWGYVNGGLFYSVGFGADEGTIEAAVKAIRAAPDRRLAQIAKGIVCDPNGDPFPTA